VIPFLVAGDPTVEQSLRLFETLLESGADMLEIGIPYSDPLADGPIIQNAARRSLAGGFRLPDVFTIVIRLRAKTNKALILFTYINPVLQFGPRQFFQEAASAGADGIIIPDLPLEEATIIRREADAAGIALIPLVAPTSHRDRISAICEQARGFVYCVSTLGVTGERQELSVDAKRLVEQVRSFTHLPVAVGFGISSSLQAKEAARYADGVIVGSAYIRRMEQHNVLDVQNGIHPESILSTIKDFTLQLVEATNMPNEQKG